MADPFIGEIKLFSYNFAPRGWAFCNGQLLSIQQNQALYSILGTTYGGDGVSNFALPDLRGRAPVHIGNSVSLGSMNGEETHVLTISEMPAHTHTVEAIADTGNSFSPQNGTWSAINSENTPAYASEANSVMNEAAVSTAGQNEAHNNMQPYIVLNYCIAIQGIYPSRN